MRAKYLSITITVIAISILSLSYHFQLKSMFVSQLEELKKNEVAIQADLAADKISYSIEKLNDNFIEIGQVEGYERLSKPQESDRAISSQLKDSAFLGMALLTPDPTWTPMWVSLNTEIIDQWSKVFLTQVWGQLPYSRLSDAQSFWYKVPTKSGELVWALIKKVQIPSTELPEKSASREPKKPAILVGFLPSTALADLMINVDDTSNEIYVVDNYNQTLYHSDLNYIGETLPQYKSFKEGEELVTFKGSQQQSFLGTQRPIENTNLFLYYGILTPSSLLISQKVDWLHFGIWLLVVLAVVGFFMLYQSGSEKALMRVKSVFKTWNETKKLDATPLKDLDGFESELKNLKAWIIDQQQELQTKQHQLQSELNSVRESSSLQDQSLLQSLKRPIMLSLGSLQVIKQKNKALTQSEEFIQVEQTLRSLKERVDMSVNASGEIKNTDFLLKEVIDECLNTQSDLIGRMGIQINVHISERLSLSDIKSRWSAVISQILLELYDWVELSTDKVIQMSFMIEEDKPVLKFKVSGCGLNPVDIQSINEASFSEVNSPTWKLIGQSLMRMNLGFYINQQVDYSEVKIFLPSQKVSNFALAKETQSSEEQKAQPPEVFKTVQTIEPKTEDFDAAQTVEPKAKAMDPRPPKAPTFKEKFAEFKSTQQSSVYEITEEDVDLDSFKVIPAPTLKKEESPKSEHDSFVSGTEIGQAPLFSEEEMQEIKKQIEEAKKGKS